MPRIIPPELVEPVVRVMLGSIDLGDGGTAQQRNLVAALVAGYWGRADLDLDALTPAEPDEAATLVVEPDHRRRMRQFLVVLEMCRHPLTDAQIDRTDAFAAALGEDGPGLEAMRVLAREGADAASTYLLNRMVEVALAETSDATFRDVPALIEAPDPDLVARLRSFADLPEGTLGRTYFDFLDGNGFTFPGEEAGMPATFLQHDMCHVICDYGPVGMEEVAVNAMALGVGDTEVRWLNMVTNLAVREAAFLLPEGYEPIAPGTLAQEGAAELFADALRRGAECTGDFLAADLFAMAAEPLDDVRARYGIQPRRV